MNSPKSDTKPHFVLVPLMAQGHTIPMIDMARLLAEHGAVISFITTPLNFRRIKTAIDTIIKSDIPIHFVQLYFPCAEVGLPEGTESIDMLPGKDQIKPFLEACMMLKEPLISHLRKQMPPPSCLIADLSHMWMADVAREFGVPRLMFNGSCGFSNFCRYIIHHNKIFDKIDDNNKPVSLTGEKILEEERGADGVVVNSFHDLEGLYINSYGNYIGQKIWAVGPMLLCNKETNEIGARGNKIAIDEQACQSWLDSRESGSVIYACFGSLANSVPAQLIELGLGLEASNRPFIWVVKADRYPDMEEWLSNGFEDRTKDRALIIRGWAPQMMIMSHPAVGGFLTHCGWNSVLESISTGVPMITWPHFAEQFLNEILIVEVLQIGVRIGVNHATHWAARENKASVERDDVHAAISKLMDGGIEEIRVRIKDLSQKAKNSMKEGGSSYENIRLLVQQTQDQLLFVGKGK
ncbi:hypothetical protein LUZ60_011499 [Juncus effusus]|nr:hypothetical protein LUZ60_011499 [Juncus effusus]